jgi:cytoskeletal protein CcmA (bactofilin family)
MFGKKQSAQISDTVETVIGPSVKVQGDFVGEGDIIVEGGISGNLQTNGSLRVGPQAEVVAEVKAANAFVAGKVVGNISVAGVLEIASTASINGDVACSSISIEAGATINGKVNMRGAAGGNGRSRKSSAPELQPEATDIDQ